MLLLLITSAQLACSIHATWCINISRSLYLFRGMHVPYFQHTIRSVHPLTTLLFVVWNGRGSRQKSCNRELETQAAGGNLFVMTAPRVISLLVVFQPFNDDNASLSVGQSLRLSGQQTMGLRSTATINSFLSFRGLSQSVSRNCSLHFQGKQHARASTDHP